MHFDSKQCVRALTAGVLVTVLTIPQGLFAQAGEHVVSSSELQKAAVNASGVGLSEVPVILLDHLTETQKRAYILADNKLALNAGWDDKLLAKELAALEADGFDRSLTGFSDEELAELLQHTQPDQYEDAVPSPPATAVSRPGDLWRLGPHRILCGDMGSPDSLATLMDGAAARMVFTDPPYNVNYEGAAGQRIVNDNLGDDFETFLRRA